MNTTTKRRAETPAESKARVQREEWDWVRSHFARAKPNRKRGLEIAAHIARAFPEISTENTAMIAMALQAVGASMCAHNEAMCSAAVYVEANTGEDGEDVKLAKLYKRARRVMDLFGSLYISDEAKARAAGVVFRVETLSLEMIIPGYEGDNIDRKAIILF